MIVSKIKDRLIENPVVGKKPYLLIKILYYLYMLTTILSADIFIGQAWEEQNHWFGFYIIGSYYLIFSINVMLGLFLVFLNQYYFKYKLNTKLLCIEAFCLIGIIVASFSFPSHFSYSDKYFAPNSPAFIFDLALIDRIHYLFSSLHLLLFFYVTFTYIPKAYNQIKPFFFYKTIIFICLLAILYSFIFENNIYTSIFKGNLDIWNREHIKSFLGHKNNYGLVLLYGMIAALFLEYYTKKVRYFGLSVVFYIAMFFSQCKTSILVGFILLAFYAWFALLTSLQDSRRRNKYIIVIAACLAVFIILLFSQGSLSRVIKQNFNTMVDWIFDKEVGTINTRRIMQERIFSLIISNPVFLIFGIGNYQFNYASFFAADVLVVNVWQPHNGFYMALGEGGLIRLISYLILTYYLIKRIFIIIFKDKNEIGYFLFVLLLIFEIRSLVEPEYFLSGSWSSVFFSYLICLPILSTNIKENGGSTFNLKYKDVNFQTILYVCCPAIIMLGLTSNNIVFQLLLISIGIIVQASSKALNDDKINQRNLSIYVYSLEAVLLLTSILLKINNMVNLATMIEFGIYSAILTFASFYLVLNLGLIKLSFISWTQIESNHQKEE